MKVHGTADDNTHFMQTMLLSKALTSRGALFKQQIYPDEGHNLGGVKQHLYRSMTLFFEDCFKKQVGMAFSYILSFFLFSTVGIFFCSRIFLKKKIYCRVVNKIFLPLLYSTGTDRGEIRSWQRWSSRSNELSRKFLNSSILVVKI